MALGFGLWALASVVWLPWLNVAAALAGGALAEMYYPLASIANSIESRMLDGLATYPQDEWGAYTDFINISWRWLPTYISHGAIGYVAVLGSALVVFVVIALLLAVWDGMTRRWR